MAKEATTPVILSLSSGKGGVGKTSLTVNLACALAQKGAQVLVVDGDMGLANVDVLLRLTVHKTIRDVLERGEDPMKAVIFIEPNLGVLAASSGVPEMVDLGPEEHVLLGNILGSIVSHFDYVLLDTAAGIGSSVLWLNTFATHNVVVVTSDPTSITDAYALIKILSREYGRKQFFLILNSVANPQEGQQTFDAIARVAEQFLGIQPHYLGCVPRDKVVLRAVQEQLPFVKGAPRSEAAKAVVELAERICRFKRD
jgi:flagellar biosynthesis protein FlhG